MFGPARFLYGAAHHAPTTAKRQHRPGRPGPGSGGPEIWLCVLPHTYALSVSSFSTTTRLGAGAMIRRVERARRPVRSAGPVAPLARGRPARPAARAGRPLAALAGALAFFTSACGVSNLAFFVDNRLHFVAPKPRAMVSLPVTISWRMTGFDVVPPGTLPVSSRSGYFAVFVDRAPIRPGQTVAAVADRRCRRTPGCVNAGYLADRGVYTTAQDSLTLRQVSNLNSYQSVQTHEVTVVILDSAGKRIGESAWYLDFRMRRLGA
jgi:hypothetical protein